MYIFEGLTPATEAFGFGSKKVDGNDAASLEVFNTKYLPKIQAVYKKIVAEYESFHKTLPNDLKRIITLEDDEVPSRPNRLYCILSYHMNVGDGVDEDGNEINQKWSDVISPYKKIITFCDRMESKYGSEVITSFPGAQLRHEMDEDDGECRLIIRIHNDHLKYLSGKLKPGLT